MVVSREEMKRGGEITPGNDKVSKHHNILELPKFYRMHTTVYAHTYTGGIKLCHLGWQCSPQQHKITNKSPVPDLRNLFSG